MVAAAGFVVSFWPRHWEITQPEVAQVCLVSRGQPFSEIAKLCGTSARLGDQPKVAEGWTGFCSAPCELRGRQILFYDCEQKLATVESLREDDYQGCLFQTTSAPAPR